MSGGPAGAPPGGFEVVTLRNGERTVRDRRSGEVMHPSVGPWREANLLYVEQTRLAERLLAENGEPLRVLDIGLGAGANAAAVLRAALELGARRRRALELISFELERAPLELALGDVAGFPHLGPVAEAARALLEMGEWCADGLRWRLHLGDVLAMLPAAPPSELVLFDPFSPRANPTLWTPAAFARVRERCAEVGEGALLATYSAATPTRVSMLLAGFFVGVGAAVGTKQETTVAATRLETLAQPLGRRWLERWQRSTARGPHGEALTPELERALLAHPQFAGT